MEKNAKIYVAGHRGLVGSALVKALRSAGWQNLILRTRAELNLTRQADVENFFAREKPDYVFLAAARVGGIYANDTYPVQFIADNLMIQNNIIHSAWKNEVSRLLFLGSSCIYPKNCAQPMQEDYLLSDYLEPTNEPYAIAKIAGIKMCEAYNRQYGTEFIAVMPTNLYGPGDNFDLQSSHVLPALLRKFHEAKIGNQPEVIVWGSGKPYREFLYVEDMAAACLFLMNLDKKRLAENLLSYPKPCFVNIGTGLDLSIAKLAGLIAEIVGYKGKISYDSNKPDGTMQKLLDVSRIKELGWQSSVKLSDGLELTYCWFQENYQQITSKLSANNKE